MSLNEKVLAAINAELPSAVANELKVFIEQAQIDRSRLDAIIIERDTKEIELKRLRGIESREHMLGQKESNLTARERAVELKEVILKHHEEFNNKRVDEIRNLVSTVFASNRLGYNVNLGVPMKDNNNYTTTAPITGIITKD